jgi:hypothetical protein
MAQLILLGLRRRKRPWPTRVMAVMTIMEAMMEAMMMCLPASPPAFALPLLLSLLLLLLLVLQTHIPHSPDYCFRHCCDDCSHDFGAD